MAPIQTSDIFSIRDVVFVISGGGSGLGAWIAGALDANGAASVFILGRRKEALERVAEGAINKKIIPVVCDITSRDSLSAAVAQISKLTPFINVLIANAAVLGPIKSHPVPYSADSISDISKALLDQNDTGIFETNFKGIHDLFASLLPLLHAGNTDPTSQYHRQHIHSQLITLSSIAALERHNRTSNTYNASKAAVVNMSQNLSSDFSSAGIRVNCIVPGLFITEMTQGYFEKPDALSLPGGVSKEQIPAERAGTAEDIAGTIIYLTSRAGAFVNGTVHVLDGGALAVESAS